MRGLDTNVKRIRRKVFKEIARVGFGLAAGGSEFKGETLDEYTKKDKEEEIQYRLPFGGGSGAGVSINPIAFLVIRAIWCKINAYKSCFIS